jgi:hypothetical protein
LDWKTKYLPCKHILHVAVSFGYDLIATWYRNHPWFTLDLAESPSSPSRTDFQISSPCECLPEGHTNVESTVSLPSLPLPNDRQLFVDSPARESTVPELSTETPPLSTQQLANAQSKLRQLLASLNTFTFQLKDISFINNFSDSLTNLVVDVKRHIGKGPIAPFRLRNTFGKKSSALSKLHQRLLAVRARRRNQRNSRKLKIRTGQLI